MLGVEPGLCRMYFDVLEVLQFRRLGSLGLGLEASKLFAGVVQFRPQFVFLARQAVDTSLNIPMCSVLFSAVSAVFPESIPEWRLQRLAMLPEIVAW